MQQPPKEKLEEHFMMQKLGKSRNESAPEEAEEPEGTYSVRNNGVIAEYSLSVAMETS